MKKHLMVAGITLLTYTPAALLTDLHVTSLPATFLIAFNVGYITGGVLAAYLAIYHSSDER